MFIHSICIWLSSVKIIGQIIGAFIGFLLQTQTQTDLNIFYDA